MKEKRDSKNIRVLVAAHEIVVQSTSRKKRLLRRPHRRHRRIPIGIGGYKVVQGVCGEGKSSFISSVIQRDESLGLQGRKPLAGKIISFRDKNTIQKNFGRSAELVRERYGNKKAIYGHATFCIATIDRVVDILLSLGHPELADPDVVIKSDEGVNSREVFVPSNDLLTLIKRHRVLTEYEREMLASLQEDVHDVGVYIDIEQLKAIVSEQIENFLTNLAQRTFFGNKHIKVKEDKGNRFAPEVFSELRDRLRLDEYYSRRVLDLLYKELVAFASVPRDREWGQFHFDGVDLWLNIKEEVFALPDIDSIDESFVEIT